MESRRFLLGAVLAASLASLGIAYIPALAAQKEIVEYRLTRWRSSQFGDSQEADEFLATLKKLECETNSQNQNGRMDVRYRCPKWKQISLKTHEEAHQWEHWLKARGFETKHVH